MTGAVCVFTRAAMPPAMVPVELRKDRAGRDNNGSLIRL